MCSQGLVKFRFLEENIILTVRVLSVKGYVVGQSDAKITGNWHIATIQAETYIAFKDQFVINIG